MTYALTGDTVNTAARLRGLAGPTRVLVGADTWRRSPTLFEADAGAAGRGQGQGAGRSSPYRIRGERGAAGGGAGPLVGRDEELREFAAVAAACAERQRGRVLSSSGRSGRRQVAARRRVCRLAPHARLFLPRRGRARLRRRDRPRRGPQPGAQPARPRRRGRCRRIAGRDRGAAAPGRSPPTRTAVPRRPARRGAPARSCAPSPRR